MKPSVPSGAIRRVIKRSYDAASIVSGDRVVFNIKGNTIGW